MIRLLAIVSLFALTIASLLAPLAAVHPGTVVIGGEYTVQPGEIRHGDMIILFARVKIAAGGEVTGQIRAFGSELTIDSAAKIDKDTQSVEPLPMKILLPSLLLVVS